MVGYLRIHYSLHPFLNVLPGALHHSLMTLENTDVEALFDAFCTKSIFHDTTHTREDVTTREDVCEDKT